MPYPFRAIGEQVHAVILGSAPTLRRAHWHGMPGSASRAGKPACEACFSTDPDDATNTSLSAIVSQAAN